MAPARAGGRVGSTPAFWRLEVEAGRATLAISPHPDDAVLSRGELLAARPGAVVLPVFAGMPRDRTRRTDRDARCRFRDAVEAMTMRCREDGAALAALGCARVRVPQAVV